MLHRFTSGHLWQLQGGILYGWSSYGSSWRINDSLQHISHCYATSFKSSNENHERTRRWQLALVFGTFLLMFTKVLKHHSTTKSWKKFSLVLRAMVCCHEFFVFQRECVSKQMKRKILNCYLYHPFHFTSQILKKSQSKWSLI